MLRAFFEQSEKNQAVLFEGLKITQEPEVMEHQGKHPVIHLTFKDIKESDWESCLEKTKGLLAEQIRQFLPLLENSLDEFERQTFDLLAHKKATLEETESSLRILSRALHQFYGRKVIFLLDEYDAPIHAGFQFGYPDTDVMTCC